MKTMTLGKKIALGFGTLILIIAILGGLATFNMKSVQVASEKLAKEYVTEAQIGEALGTAVWGGQFAVRGYAFTGNNSYLEEARATLQSAQKQAEAAQKLSDQYPELVKLRESIQDLAPSLKTYEDLVNQTEAKTKNANAVMDRLIQSGVNFIASTDKLIADQTTKFEKEIKASTEAAKLQERLKKLELAIEVRAELNAVRVSVFKSKAQRDLKLMEEGLKTFESIDGHFATLFGMLQAAEDIAELNKVKAEALNYRDTMKELLIADSALLSLDKDRGEMATRLRTLADNTSKNGMGQTVDAANGASQKLSMASWVVIIGLVVALVVGVVVAFGIIRSTNKVLSGLATTLDDGSNQVAAAAGQVSAASQSLAEGASEQAASLEETSASLEEMSSMTQRNAENAQKAKELTHQARSAADLGAGNMQAMNTAMQDIKVSSDEIGKIIKTIDEIAFQTNILALNAAVEAARAGEAGMGFAVVADEVRNLAQRCAQSAKETAAKIEGAITKTAQGVEISTKVTETLQEIVVKVRQVDELVGEVATASREQSQGITQVNTAVGQMDKVTQSNAANAEESASASEELNAQAESLKDAVAQLLQLVGGQATTAAKSATPVRRNAPKAEVKAPAPQKAAQGSNGHSTRPSRQQPALAVAGNGRRSELPLDGDFKDF